jgi:hypothetical protein
VAPPAPIRTSSVRVIPVRFMTLKPALKRSPSVS